MIPANDNTLGTPTAKSERIRPSWTISTADGVPTAPNWSATSKAESTRMVDRRPRALFSDTLPVETTIRSGAPVGRFRSHSLRSESIRLQKRQLGFQNKTNVLLPG